MSPSSERSSKKSWYRRPEQPPGCTAMRRRRSSRPSCSIRGLTLTAATSVRMTPVGAAGGLGRLGVRFSGHVRYLLPVAAGHLPYWPTLTPFAAIPNPGPRCRHTWSPAPLPGQPGGQLAQAPGRLGQRLLLGAEVLDQRVRLGDPGARRLPVAGLVAPARRPRRAGRGRGRRWRCRPTTLPRSDWWSNEPSPVITRSAGSSSASSPISAGDQADAGDHPAAEGEQRGADPARRAAAGQRAQVGRRRTPAPARRRSGPAPRPAGSTSSRLAPFCGP